MFEVKYYQHTTHFYERFRIHEGEIHLTQSTALAQYLRSVTGASKSQVLAYHSFVRKLFPHWNHPHTEIYLRSMIRQYIHQHASEESMNYLEKKVRDFYLSLRFLIEMGMTRLFDFPSMQLKEEQKFLIGMFEQLRHDPIVVSYRQERAHLTKKKMAETLNIDTDIHTVCVHHFDYIDAVRMMMFYQLQQIGLHVIFYIPFNPHAPNVYQTWRKIYERVSGSEYSRWECVENSQPRRGAKFARYLGDRFLDQEDPLHHVRFLTFDHTTEFKEYLQKHPIVKNHHEVVAKFEEDLNIYTNYARNDHFYASRYGQFFLSLQNCRKTNNGIFLTYDDYVNMMTSGWVQSGHVNGTQALTLLIDLRSYMDGVKSFQDIMERLQALVDLQEVSRVFDETAKEQAGSHRLKRYLSNPFRCFPYVHQSRYKITVKQLIECTKDLARKVNRLLLGEREKRNVRVYIKELNDIYVAVSGQWEPSAKQKMEKLFSVLIPVDWEFTMEELYQFITLHLGAVQDEEEDDQDSPQIVNIDQLIGKTLIAHNIHVTDLSLRTFPWEQSEMPHLLTHSWLKECIRRSFVAGNRIMRMNALVVDYYSRNVTRNTALYSIYHLLAYGKGQITFSYIKDLYEHDGPSIYFTVLQELYGQMEEVAEEQPDEWKWEEETVVQEEISKEPLLAIPDLLWLDSDFCQRKFFFNAFVEHHPIYENDFHQQQAFAIIGKLLAEQGDGEVLVRETIFPLFPQWTNAHKQNLLDTTYPSSLRTYKSYQNIYYPKAMKRLQRLGSRYMVTKNWKAKYQYDHDTFRIDEHIKEFLSSVQTKEIEARSGQHCRMCPFLHVCKDGEYVIDANDS
ncbi:hypothetical protein ABEO92_12205 [Geobacillus stearothermophilus]|uniref:hypothetical protein n=1 Tax=Geobacillus stearothermophilus TaxID=1422 RepID=UPI003D2255AD